MKNNCALRNQSMRRDRVSLSSATKNSLIMVSMFVMCSLPMLICSIPGVVQPGGSITRMTAPLLVCRIVFLLNGPVYPIWYLAFSKRVRKCLHNLYENVLLHYNLRQ